MVLCLFVFLYYNQFHDKTRYTPGHKNIKVLKIKKKIVILDSEECFSFVNIIRYSWRHLLLKMIEFRHDCEKPKMQHNSCIILLLFLEFLNIDD